MRRDPNVLWVLLGFDGRIDREVFWLANAFLLVASFLFLSPSVDPASGAIRLGLLGPFAVLFLLWTQLALAAKRLHDHGMTGWLALFCCVPFLGLVAFVFIGVLPTESRQNAYGPGPNRRGPQ